MHWQTSLPIENHSLPLQVDTDQTASFQDAASWTSIPSLRRGFGLAVVMLIGVSACLLLPRASHASAIPAPLLPEVGFSPTMPRLYSGSSPARPTDQVPRSRLSLSQSMRPGAYQGPSLFGRLASKTSDRGRSSHLRAQMSESDREEGIGARVAGAWGRAFGRLADSIEPGFMAGSASGADEEKFVRYADLPPSFAPLGVVCVGFSVDDLDTIGTTVDAVNVDDTGHVGATLKPVPVVALGKADLRLKLRDVLSQLQARDSELPDDQASLRAPLIMLSGFSPQRQSETIQAIRSLRLQQTPMFAAAVPNAMEKSLMVLIEEIEGDFLKNAAPV